MDAKISVHNGLHGSACAVIRERLLQAGSAVHSCWGSDPVKVVVDQFNDGIDALFLSTVGLIGENLWGWAYVLHVRQADGKITTKFSTYFADLEALAETALHDLEANLPPRRHVVSALGRDTTGLLPKIRYSEAKE